MTDGRRRLNMSYRLKSFRRGADLWRRAGHTGETRPTDAHRLPGGRQSAWCVRAFAAAASSSSSSLQAAVFTSRDPVAASSWTTGSLTWVNDVTSAPLDGIIILCRTLGSAVQISTGVSSALLLLHLQCEKQITSFSKHHKMYRDIPSY